MLIKLFLILIFLITAYWNSKNVMPMIHAEAFNPAYKSIFIIVMMLIAMLLVLKSPWCVCEPCITIF